MALEYYMKRFKKVYPTGPDIAEVFPEYKKAVAGTEEFLIDIACEEALKRCKFFPTPAELVSFVPKQEPEFPTTTTFDLTADFVPVEQWYERHLKTNDLLVIMDKHGRKKVKQVPVSAGREYKIWPAHWNSENAPAISWDEARKKIAAIGKLKSL